MLLVVRHNSPRLPRELPLLLASETGRALITATVSDAQPDPMAAALAAAPDGRFPSGALLSITGAEDLAVSTDDRRSVAALFEFARRLDLRRDQFLPNGGVVIVWATARVFDALAEHALNFISLASAVLTLTAVGDSNSAAQVSDQEVRYDTSSRHYRLPVLPADAPQELQVALRTFEELSVINELYSQGGAKIAHALAHFDAAHDRIEESWNTIRRWSDLENLSKSDPEHDKTLRDFARALLAVYPGVAVNIFSLRQHPNQRIDWLRAQQIAARLIGNHRQEAAALGNLGNIFVLQGKVPEAIDLYNQVLVVFRENNDRKEESATLGNLGNAYFTLGDIPQATKFNEQSLAIARELGDRYGEAYALSSLGSNHFVSGNPVKAVEFHQQALAITHLLGDRRAEANILGNLGNAYAALGETRQAIWFYQQQLAIANELGDLYSEANALWNSAKSFWELGERKAAFTNAESALALSETIESPLAKKMRLGLAEWRKA